MPAEVVMTTVSVYVPTGSESGSKTTFNGLGPALPESGWKEIHGLPSFLSAVQFSSPPPMFLMVTGFVRRAVLPTAAESMIMFGKDGSTSRIADAGALMISPIRQVDTPTPITTTNAPRRSGGNARRRIEGRITVGPPTTSLMYPYLTPGSRAHATSKT